MSDILIETKQIGSIVKVCAVDALTGAEVSFQAPVSTSLAYLKQLAVRKLAYVQRKQD